MSAHKSPFFVLDDFIPPLLCEEIVDTVQFDAPDYDPDKGTPLASVCKDDEYEQIIYERFEPIIRTLEQYYSFEHHGTERLTFEWLPQAGVIPVHGENADFIEKQWVKTRKRDITCVLFLSDYNEKIPFDSDFECYGGKLEFINHQFSFTPSRGTLIIFPSDPRFSNASSTVLSGDLFQVRFHLSAKTPYIYDPSNFPGDYRTWF